MRIIDAHMHLGEDLLYLTDDSEELLLRTMENCGVSELVLQPGIVARDQRQAHERIRRFADAHPGRVHGMACFHPLMGDEAYRGLVRWAVKDLGFKSIKMHPAAFAMAPSHPAAERIYELAEELDVAVMIHTGNGSPAALPALCIPVARTHPQLRLVMGHAGGGAYGAEALVVAQECPNVYLETSWTTVYDLAAMVAKLGPRRVMFGTDVPPNVPVELAKYRALGLSDADLEWCFWKTASEAFRLDA